MPLDPSQIGKRLETSRKRLKLSKAEVARRLNVDAATVRRWEKGTQRIKAENLIALAELYGESWEGLVAERSNGAIDVKRGAHTSGRVAETAARYEGGITFTTSPSGHEGRVWLQEFVLELTRAGADDDFVAWARRFLTSSENFVIYYGGQPEEMTDEQKLRHMKGLAEGVRAILKDRLKKGRAR